MEFITVKEAAQKFNLTERRVHSFAKVTELKVVADSVVYG